MNNTINIYEATFKVDLAKKLSIYFATPEEEDGDHVLEEAVNQIGEQTGISSNRVTEIQINPKGSFELDNLPMSFHFVVYAKKATTLVSNSFNMLLPSDWTYDSIKEEVIKRAYVNENVAQSEIIVHSIESAD